MIRWTRYLWIRWHRGSWVLLALCACNAAAAGVLGVALPWRVIALRGDQEYALAVGFIATRTLGYAFSSFFLGRLGDRFGSKRMVLIASALSGVCILLMPLAPSVGTLYVLGLMNSVACGLFWPPMMSWVSAAHEGPRLGRRLSMLNLAWSLGLGAGPILGAAAWAVSPTAAFLSGAACSVLPLLLVAAVRSPIKSGRTQVEPEHVDLAPRRDTFRWLSRIGMVTTFAAAGSVGYPLASLIKSMSLGPGTHGGIQSGWNLVMMGVFLLMSLRGHWQYRAWILMAAQALVAVLIASIGAAPNAPVLSAVVIAAAAGTGFAYNSSLFYSVSASRSRSTSAAVNEFLGYVSSPLGALAAGALGQAIGLRKVYPFMGALVLAGLIAQTVVYAASRRAGKARLPAP